MSVMINSKEQQLIEMAAILGLDEPVSDTVLQAAVADSTYAHHLLVCRDQPEFLNQLLSNPPTIPQAATLSSSDLITKAAGSLVRWAKTGFTTVDDDIYQKRLTACQSCPNLRTPPLNQSTLYAMAGANSNERTICGLCGCVATVKARRTSESCPASHPAQPGFTRWNEAVWVDG